MQITTKQLRQARALIEDPARWGKWGGWSVQGSELCVAQALAQIVGAYIIIHGRYGNCPLCAEISAGSCIAYNDAVTTTHADAVALYDRAIATAEASGK